MKVNNHRQGIIAAATWECRSDIVRLWLIFLLLLSAVCAKAQEIPVRHRFSPGEEVQYELYFKWGLLMPRAGHATLSIRDAEYEGEPSYHYRLIFRTSGIIEKVYKMRDTIDCHFTPDMLLLRSEKRVNENDYYLIDDIRFSYDRKKILAHSHRYTPTRTKIDTMLVTEDLHMLMTENRRKAFDRELHCKEYESWDKLMHVLTHEIMNSIAPVVSLSGTLLSYFRTKDAPKSSGEITDATIRKTIRGLDTIKSQGQTLMHFTESYRQFAYLKQPEPEPFPLTYLLQNLQTLYLPDMQRQHIDFSLVLFQPEITVHADEKLLSQVLINLLKNAMQALEGQADGKIRMEVDTEKNQLLIRVTDNGPGVPSDLIEDIFVPFFTTKATGSGIGLSLSRQIIRMHGGELSVASLPYRETCFTVSLPVKP